MWFQQIETIAKGLLFGKSDTSQDVACYFYHRALPHQLAPVGSIRIAWDKTQPRTSKSNSERKWNEALEIFRTWVIFLYFLPVVWHSDDGNLYVDIRLCLCVYQKAFQLMRWLLLIVLHASTLIPKMVYGLRENDEPFHQLSASQVNANLNHVVPNSATWDFTSVFYRMALSICSPVMYLTSE